MNTINAVRNRIPILCKERKIAVNRLASIFSLPSLRIKNISRGRNRKPKLLTIKMIYNGLIIMLNGFLISAEFDAPEQDLRQLNVKFRWAV